MQTQVCSRSIIVPGMLPTEFYLALSSRGLEAFFRLLCPISVSQREVVPADHAMIHRLSIKQELKIIKDQLRVSLLLAKSAERLNAGGLCMS